MTKSELAELVSMRTGLDKKDISFILSESLIAIKEALLKGEYIVFQNFGKFILRDKKGRMGRDIVRGLPLYIKPHKKVFFKPSEDFRKTLKKATEWDDTKE